MTGPRAGQNAWSGRHARPRLAHSWRVEGEAVGGRYNPLRLARGLALLYAFGERKVPGGSAQLARGVAQGARAVESASRRDCSRDAAAAAAARALTVKAPTWVPCQCSTTRASLNTDERFAMLLYF